MGDKPLPSRTPGPLGYNDAHDPAVGSRGSASKNSSPSKPPQTSVRRYEAPRGAKSPPLIRLAYEAADADLLGLTVKKTSTIPIAGSKILARDGNALFLHGNNRIEVFQDDRRTRSDDGTAKEAIYRLMRLWVAPLDPTTRQRSGAYSTGTHGYFTNDGTGGQLWIDVPGESIGATPSERFYRRHLMEFLVGVQGNPDAGGLYFMVVLDETPDQYRVTMHREISFDGEKWKALFPDGFRFQEQKNQRGEVYEERVMVGITLARPYAEEDDLPEILTYGGWQSFPKP